MVLVPLETKMLLFLCVFFFLNLISAGVLEYQNYNFKCIYDGEAFLTFDGGPSANNTVKLLEILKKENITGAFFITTRNMESNVAIVKQAMSAGHVIGYRLESEWDIAKMSDEGLYNSIERKLGFIKSKIGKKPKLIRDNMEGDEVQVMTSSVLTKLRYAGYALVGSQISLKDGNLTKINTYPEPFQAVALDLAKLGRNDSPIIRMHDTNWLSVNQTLNVIEQVKGKGMKFVSFSQCFGLSDAYFEDNKKITPFYGNNPRLKTLPEDEGKIFSGQLQNNAILSVIIPSKMLIGCLLMLLVLNN